MVRSFSCREVVGDMLSFEDGGCLGLEEIGAHYQVSSVFLDDCYVARR